MNEISCVTYMYIQSLISEEVILNCQECTQTMYKYEQHQNYRNYPVNTYICYILTEDHLK